VLGSRLSRCHRARSPKRRDSTNDGEVRTPAATTSRPQTAGTIAALLTLREQVIGPILGGVRSPRRGRNPATWTSVDRDYEKIRIDMQTLFQDLGIRAAE
jgi:hypothetical protein